MILTYKEFKAEFDKGGKGLRKLSQFSREHPDDYQKYRERMRNEQAKEQREKNSRL